MSKPYQQLRAILRITPSTGVSCRGFCGVAFPSPGASSPAIISGGKRWAMMIECSPVGDQLRSRLFRPLAPEHLYPGGLVSTPPVLPDRGPRPADH
jgi:hypothetical protein